MDPGDTTPRRFALKYDPPAIVMEYSNAEGNLFHCKVTIKNLTADMDASEVSAALIRSHAVLQHPKVKRKQIERLVLMLLNHKRQEPGAGEAGEAATAADASSAAAATPPAVTAPAAGAAASDGIDLSEVDDLQKVDEAVLVAVKDKMNEDFQRNFVGQDHPDFEYDKKVDFGEGEESCDWDQEEGEEEEEVEGGSADEF